MPLTLLRARSLTSAVGDEFALIGHSHATRMPKAKLATEGVAYEYWLSTHVGRLSDARKKAAVKAAVAAGVMFDPEKDPREAGTAELVYGGDIVEIGLAVTTGADRLDQLGFVAELMEKFGITAAAMNRILAKHTKTNRAPHSFKATLATAA